MLCLLPVKDAGQMKENSSEFVSTFLLKRLVETTSCFSCFPIS